MDTLRKYIRSGNEMDSTQPDWGVEVFNVGHYVHSPDKKYPDPIHPDGYFFDYAKGRLLYEYQLIYIVSRTGTLRPNLLVR